MKKTLLIFSLIAVFSLGGYAQTSEVRYGIKAGPTFDWASAGSTSVKGYGPRLGFNAGLVSDFYFTNNIAVSSGVNLCFLREKYSFTDCRFVEDFLEETNVSVLRRMKAVNMEIPIKVKLRFGVSDSFSAFVEAGGGLGVNFKDLCHDEYDFYWVAFEDQDYRDCTNQYRLLQVSMLFGLGAEYELNSKVSAFAQLTFNHSFSNAFVSSLEKQTGSILRNNYVGIEVGLIH